MNLDTITAQGNWSVWCANAIALSTGQLPFQISQSCTHNVWTFVPPFRGDVSLDLLKELVELATLNQ